MRKALLITQLALIASLLINIRRKGAGAIDWITLSLLFTAAGLNGYQEIRKEIKRASRR